MINSANKYTIAQIFWDDPSVKYTIPKYQREYTWNKDNWEELLNDIQENEWNHFIWSIICINNWTDTLSTPMLELVDWQQRLSTVSLLYCAIHKLLSDKNTENDEDLKMELHILKLKLINKKDSKSKMELSHQNNNFNDYKWVLNEIWLLKFGEEVKNKWNRKIFKAFRFFTEKLSILSVDELLELLGKTNNTLLVKIEVNSHSDAFMLFESLNNRWVPLSAIDLIKNKLLAEVEKNKIMDIDEAFLDWNKIINNLDEYSIQERYLRQYYNAFKFDERIKVDWQSKATKSNLIKIYETLINRDIIYIFSELIEKSSIYHDLMLPNESENTLIKWLRNELIDLNHVKAAPSYLFLLYAFSFSKDRDADFYKKTVNLLVKYFIRRNITDFPNTRNLDQIFIDLIQEINQDINRLNFEYISEYLTHPSRYSDDDNFKKHLNWDLYETNIDATRFILSKIEESKRTKETKTDFWQSDDNKKLVWTIEHIFPEWKNIPKSWIDMIAEWNKEEAERMQTDLVHKIWNLTLTWYNQNLSNFDFVKKRDRKDNNDNFIWYKNNLFLNEDVVNKESWIKENIQERTEKLVNIALDIFNI
ncbi:MAG: hypothetical protein ACD_3C00086G0033 [uncultured bacterium (gcode 4)]|uniref:Uncharacterized protein n=1 Tax=uncultured bacterium (gcode 4) TaxID=1234023 RepID=K2GDA2_9BACT|nr:MAG: hypothetical protein ACD_3C00086G0033 [uncultured bacterium (gcode 4)]